MSTSESFHEGIVPKLVQDTEPDIITIGPTLQVEVPDTEVTEFVPIAVTRLGGTLPWSTNSKQLQCGETVVSNNGDENNRLNYEAICTKSQFETLVEMRSNPTGIKLVSAGYTGRVTFDQLKWDRITDANGQILYGTGENNEPLYKIQLQSKETSQ